MAGVKIGGATISIGDAGRNGAGRTRYGVFIDLPDGRGFEVTDLSSGCQGGGVQEGMASLLDFLSAAAESFPRPVAEWAAQFADEISLLQMEIEETPDLIED